MEIPDRLRIHASSSSASSSLSKGGVGAGGDRGPTKNISDVIDVVGNGAGTPPARKRKAALEQSNVLKKIKNKNF